MVIVSLSLEFPCWVSLFCAVCLQHKAVWVVHVGVRVCARPWFGEGGEERIAVGLTGKIPSHWTRHLYRGHAWTVIPQCQEFVSVRIHGNKKYSVCVVHTVLYGNPHSAGNCIQNVDTRPKFTRSGQSRTYSRFTAIASAHRRLVYLPWYIESIDPAGSPV